jgi:hypothetical protein
MIVSGLTQTLKIAAAMKRHPISKIINQKLWLRKTVLTKELVKMELLQASLEDFKNVR